MYYLLAFTLCCISAQHHVCILSMTSNTNQSTMNHEQVREVSLFASKAKINVLEFIFPKQGACDFKDIFQKTLILSFEVNGYRDTTCAHIYYYTIFLFS